MLHSFPGAANHHAITTLQSPHAATRADVDVIDLFFAQVYGATRVIFVIGIAAIDDGVARVHSRGEIVHGLFRRITGRDHNPNRARLAQLTDEIIKRT